MASLSFPSPPSPGLKGSGFPGGLPGWPFGSNEGERDPLEGPIAPAQLQRQTRRLGSLCWATEETTCKGIAEIFKGAEPERRVLWKRDDGRSCLQASQQEVIPEAPPLAAVKGLSSGGVFVGRGMLTSDPAKPCQRGSLPARSLHFLSGTFLPVTHTCPCPFSPHSLHIQLFIKSHCFFLPVSLLSPTPSGLISHLGYCLSRLTHFPSPHPLLRNLQLPRFQEDQAQTPYFVMFVLLPPGSVLVDSVGFSAGFPCTVQHPQTSLAQFNIRGFLPETPGKSALSSLPECPDSFCLSDLAILKTCFCSSSSLSSFLLPSSPFSSVKPFLTTQARGSPCPQISFTWTSPPVCQCWLCPLLPVTSREGREERRRWCRRAQVDDSGWFLPLWAGFLLTGTSCLGSSRLHGLTEGKSSLALLEGKSVPFPTCSTHRVPEIGC